jgi:hypothetical protein
MNAGSFLLPKETTADHAATVSEISVANLSRTYQVSIVGSFPVDAANQP